MGDIPSFGTWLKRRRKALDLTQDSLAQLVGCAVVTIRKLEAEVQPPSRQLAERLANHLAIPPAERETFIQFARLGLDAAPPELPLPAAVGVPTRPVRARSPEISAPNLPLPSTPLIGRAGEVAAVCSLLQQTHVRLLSLTGPGGVGKTRLGLQVAATLRDQFTDGVVFVALAPIQDADLVVATIAQALGIKEMGGRPLIARLKDTLRDQQLLLLLDNFEHVVAAAPSIAELLAAAPGLKALITSRAVLHLLGEQEYSVPPLALPDRQQLLPIETLAACDAVALFVTRARAANPDFRLTQASAAAVSEICHRLDGLPLAIELAAARSKVLAASVLLARLEPRLPLLTGGARDLPARQQTLRSTIDWSYQLLDEREQRLFRRLGVFVGGWSLEAAETICTANGGLAIDIVDGVAALLDKSMFRQEAVDGEPRFTMLETIREYALERLAETGEADATRRQHAAYYLALAETAEREVHKPAGGTWQERLAAEHDNLRAALHWAVEGGAVETSLRLAAALWYFWMVQGHVTEGRNWLAAALGPHMSPSVLRAAALNGAGYLASSQGDYAAANRLLAESLALYRELGDKRSIAWTLSYLGYAKMMQGDYSQATALREESLALFQELGDNPGITFLLIQLGESASLQGDHERAVALIEESLVHSREHEDKLWLAWGLKLLGNLAQREGDAGRAKVLLAESLALFEEIGNLTGVTAYLEGMAEVATLQGQLARVVVLFGAAATLRTRLGTLPYPAEQAAYDRQLVAARDRLGADAFDAAWAEGRTMTLEQAIAEALGGAA